MKLTKAQARSSRNQKKCFPASSSPKAASAIFMQIFFFMPAYCINRLQAYKITRIIFVAGLFLCGCQKKVIEVKCYLCDMTYSSGIPAGTQYPCSADIAQWQKEQKDNNGNPIQSICREE
jgi:hypothetical protein